MTGFSQGRPNRAYFWVGLLLLSLSPLYYYARLSLGLNVFVAVSVMCLAALSCTFALLPNTLGLSAWVRALLAWFYGIGIVMAMSSWPWLQDLLAMFVRDAEWRRRLGTIDLIFPGMALIPILVILRGVLRGDWKRPARVCLVGGLCLLTLWTIKLWLNLFEIHFAATTNARSFMAQLLWMPVCLMVATAGMILGCVVQKLCLSSRRASVMALCYLLAVAFVPLGFYATLIGRESLGYAGLLVVTIGIFTPAALIVQRWIVLRPTGSAST
ncbi:MAG TPA: hypothetical protein VE621_05450 [Bryobacteraceae bacterium]|jgi:hypothetical protein|nr:hypothetical protein [Bryobacteraceae bacterium]